VEEDVPSRKTSHYIDAFAALLSRAPGTLPEQLLQWWLGPTWQEIRLWGCWL
jgi:hypothetical protein